MIFFNRLTTSLYHTLLYWLFDANLEIFVIFQSLYRFGSNLGFFFG